MNSREQNAFDSIHGEIWEYNWAAIEVRPESSRVLQKAAARRVRVHVCKGIREIALTMYLTSLKGSTLDHRAIVLQQPTGTSDRSSLHDQ
jgi:hypothetical protein